MKTAGPRVWPDVSAKVEDADKKIEVLQSAAGFLQYERELQRR